MCPFDSLQNGSPRSHGSVAVLIEKFKSGRYSIAALYLIVQREAGGRHQSGGRRSCGAALEKLVQPISHFQLVASRSRLVLGRSLDLPTRSRQEPRPPDSFSAGASTSRLVLGRSLDLPNADVRRTVDMPDCITITVVSAKPLRF